MVPSHSPDRRLDEKAGEMPSGCVGRGRPRRITPLRDRKRAYRATQANRVFRQPVSGRRKRPRRWLGCPRKGRLKTGQGPAGTIRVDKMGVGNESEGGGSVKDAPRA